MKIIKSIFSVFLTYKVFAFIESIFYYIRDYNRLSDFFYGDNFKRIILKYLRCELKKDWIGRLYGIINPNLDIEGNLDISSMVIEIDGMNTNNEEYVKNWIYRQLMLVDALFKMERFYNHISLTLKHVGPINHDNYLLVFDLSSRKYMGLCFRRMLIHMLVYIVIGLIIFFMI